MAPECKQGTRATNAEVTRVTSEILTADAMTPDEAVTWITEAYVKSVASIIETGRRLVEARSRVPHGQWGRVVEGLPFGQEAARQLMRIAQYPALNSNHGWNLPASWRTLAVLTQVPEAEFPALVESGAIHADMTRAEATELAQTYQAGMVADLNQWVALADAARAAMGMANERDRIPDPLPEGYTPLSRIISDLRAAVARLETFQ